MRDDLLPISGALDWMATQLEESVPGENPYRDISFRDFFFDIFTLSFPGKDFDTWHIHLLIDDIERAFEEGLNFCGVLPRYHLKSTVGGYAVAIWRMLTVPNPKILYLSFKDGMARYHLSEIKQVIRDNPILSRLMRDLTSRSLATCRYAIEGMGVGQILSGGVLSFKRGIHVNGCVIADDVLRDPQNPLNLSQLLVVEKHMRAEIANIPNKGIPMLVWGTPMHQQDILLKLKDDKEYIWRLLPALRPSASESAEVYDQREVLWEKQYPLEWLERKARSDWYSFQTEFLLTPVMEIGAFFTREELVPVLDENLFNHSLYIPYHPAEDDEAVFGGYDVGKKRHPSHLTLLVRKRDGTLKMIHQTFHDNIDYQEQAKRLEFAVENFNLRLGYIDNTRGEMEERGLSPEWRLIPITSKFKKEMATFFGKYVSEKRVKLIDDVRYVSQLIAVTSDLRPLETPMGHGESFYSTGLAILAHERVYGGGGIEIGDASFLVGPSLPSPSLTVVPRVAGRCISCGSAALSYRRNGQNIQKLEEATEALCLECHAEFSLVERS